MAAPVHHHLIVRAEVKKPLSDVELTKNWLTELVDKIGINKILGPHAAYVDKEGNKGVNGFVIIENSHIALHVWDEMSPALVQLDVYTCSCLPLEVVFDHLDVMQPRKIEYKFLDREHGLKFVK